jgi:hypothetical protein
VLSSETTVQAPKAPLCLIVERPEEAVLVDVHRVLDTRIGDAHGLTVAVEVVPPYVRLRQLGRMDATGSFPRYPQLLSSENNVRIRAQRLEDGPKPSALRRSADSALKAEELLRSRCLGRWEDLDPRECTQPLQRDRDRNGELIEINEQLTIGRLAQLLGTDSPGDRLPSVGQLARECVMASARAWPFRQDERFVAELSKR